MTVADSQHNAPDHSELALPAASTLRRRAATSVLAIQPSHHLHHNNNPSASKHNSNNHTTSNNESSSLILFNNTATPPLRRVLSETFWHSWDRSPQQIYKTINPITGEIQCRTYSSTYIQTQGGAEEEEGEEEDNEGEEEDDDEEEEEEEDDDEDDEDEEGEGEEGDKDEGEKSGGEGTATIEEAEQGKRRGESASATGSGRDGSEGKSEQGSGIKGGKRKSGKRKEGKKRQKKNKKSNKSNNNDNEVTCKAKRLKKQMLINMREYSKTLTGNQTKQRGAIISLFKTESGSSLLGEEGETKMTSSTSMASSPRTLSKEILIEVPRRASITGSMIMTTDAGEAPLAHASNKEACVSAGSLNALVATFVGEIEHTQLGSPSLHFLSPFFSLRFLFLSCSSSLLFPFFFCHFICSTQLTDTLHPC